MRIKTLEQDKINLQESLKMSQVQKDMMFDEAEKIQNFQQQEISKLKNLLLFREQVKREWTKIFLFQQEIYKNFQESLDQLNKLKTDEGQIDILKVEISRIKNLEPMFEKLKVISYFLSLNARSCVTKKMLLCGKFRTENPSHVCLSVFLSALCIFRTRWCLWINQCKYEHLKVFFIA